MQKPAQPETTKKLVACLSCKLILCQDQFSKEYQGKCPNFKVCRTAGLDNYDDISEKTTRNFSGMIARIGNGWVAKYQDIGDLVQGVYAISVNNELRMQQREYEEYDEGDEREVSE